MLTREPQDAFLRYALAMELDSAGQPSESLSAYDELMRDQPPHVPSFFRAGQLLVRMGNLEQAREVLHRGIHLAQAGGDAHAAAEMNELLQSIAASDEPL